MNQATSAVLTELKDLLILSEELGLLEGRKVTPEKFKKIVPKLAKRTEKILIALEKDESDYTDPNYVTQELEDEYKNALRSAEKADKAITKLVKGVKTEARYRSVHRSPGYVPKGMGDYDPPDEGPERENDLSREQDKYLVDIYKMVRALTDGVRKLYDDLEGVLDPKTFKLLEDYEYALEDLEGAMTGVCRAADIRGI